MPVVSSAIVEDAPQRDGRRWIAERHVDHLGVARFLRYLAVKGLNVTAIMTARIAGLNAELTRNEVDANIASVIAFGKDAVVIRNYSTVAQNAAALRAVYLTSTRLESIMIGEYLSTLTDGVLQTAFGLTSGQTTTLRTNKLTPAATQAAAIRIVAGA